MERMAPEEIVRIARECLARRGIGLSEVDRVVDMEQNLRDSELAAGRPASERFRSMVKGKFAVHFPKPCPPGRAIDPACITVIVDSATGSASIFPGM